MRYRKQYRKVRRAPDEELREFIAEHIRNTSSRANREEALTYMVQAVRQGGLHFPTQYYAAEAEFERLGFTLRREQRGSMTLTYVQLGDDNDHR